MQSAHITEVHFWIHNRIKKRVLEALLEATKQAWTESGKKKLHYITDDMTRIFLDISDDFYILISVYSLQIARWKLKI